jgi:glycosyltransferase involved in cell wall biosynthesis
VDATLKIPWHVSVLIPARNEEELLPRCLRSVVAACDRLPPSITCDVVVAVDCSKDRTFEIAKEMIVARQLGIVVDSQVGMVGRARAVATEAALLRHLGYHDRWWLANTDADCEVPTDWLTKQLAFAYSGIDAVAGIIEVDSFVGHQACVAERFRQSYLVRPDGSHHHVHGANLGIRADAYLRAGGWHSLATAEDHDLWKRLGAIGCNRLSTDQLAVLTSGRRVGRAPCGFADALAAHNESAA